MPTPSIRLQKYAPRQDGSQALYLQIYLQRKKLWLPLDLHVLYSDWDAQRERIRASHPQAEEINMLIGQALSRANEILIEARLSREELTVADFRERWETGSSQDFLAFWESAQAQQEQVGAIASNTSRAHTRVRLRIKAFIESQGMERLPFSKITASLFSNFDKWMIELLKTDSRQGRATRAHQQKVIKKYLNMAKKSGKRFAWPYPDGHKVWYQAPEKVFLSQQEVKQVQKYYRKIETAPLRIAVRAFLVQCFSGLRIGDVRALPLGADKGEALLVVPEKTRDRTGKSVRISITPPLRELLACPHLPEDRDYIAANYPRRKFTPLVPVQAPSNLREHLVTMAKEVGIDKHITSHVGRHTFATMFLERGGSVEVLQRLLGHADISTTMIYVHLTEARQRDQLQSAFEDF